MESVIYKKEQIDKVFQMLNQVEVKGASVTLLAMALQELNNGEVLINEEAGDE